MGKLTVGSPALVDAATVTAGSSASADLGVANIQDPQPSVPWRSASTDAGDCYIQVDFGGAVTVDFAALVGCTLSADGSWRWRMADTAEALTGGSPTLDTDWLTDPAAGVTVGGRPPLLAHRLDAPVTAAFARIDFDDADNAAGHVELARLAIDLGFRPGGGRAVRYGWGVDLRSGDLVDQALDGATQGDPRWIARVLTFAVPAIAADAWGAWLDLLLARGRARDVVAVFDPEAGALMARQAIHGRFDDLGGITQSRLTVHEIRCRIFEVL